MLNPGGLPSCGQFATGPCRGDGTTLKERLEALVMIGEVNVTGITSDGIAGDDAEVCGVDSVRGFIAMYSRMPMSCTTAVLVTAYVGLFNVGIAPNTLLCPLIDHIKLVRRPCDALPLPGLDHMDRQDD